MLCGFGSGIDLGDRLSKDNMVKCHYAFLASGLLLLVGCGESGSSKEKKQPSAAEAKMVAEARSLTDPSRGSPEFLHRLRTSVQMRNGVLIVDDPLTFGLSVLSPNSPWVVNCGIGIEVVFASANSSDDRVKIQLALIPITKERCRELAPLIGKEIQTILSEG